MTGLGSIEPYSDDKQKTIYYDSKTVFHSLFILLNKYGLAWKLNWL